MGRIERSKEEGRRIGTQNPLVAGALVGCLVIAVGCAPLRQRREPVETSGFLGDYSQLQKNENYPAYLTYINPSAQWSKYDAILIDSLALYGTKTDELSPEDRQTVAGMCYNSLFDTLSKNFKIAISPGPKVLRLRSALTQAQGSQVALNVVTSVIPQAKLVSSAGGMAADTATLVGEASAEAEFLDSLSNQRLAAAVDRQTGTKAVIRGHKFDKWGDVQDACNYWAERTDKFLVDQGVRQKAQ